MFAIYPTVDAEKASEHAVIFTDDAHIAWKLCLHFGEHYGTPHSAFLVMPSWPDPKLIQNLNGCGPDVQFSVRDPHAADKASWTCRQILGIGHV